MRSLVHNQWNEPCGWDITCECGATKWTTFSNTPDNDGWVHDTCPSCVSAQAVGDIHDAVDGQYYSPLQHQVHDAQQ